MFVTLDISIDKVGEGLLERSQNQILSFSKKGIAFGKKEIS